MSDPRLLGASLNIASMLLRELSSRDNEHEENLTGALLGMLLASNTVLTLFAGTPLQLAPSQLWWSSYGKYRSKDFEKTEAGSGADFALLTLPKPGRARIALFQAKRGEKKGAQWLFDANRVPKPLKEGDARASQMIVLAATAKRITRAAGQLTRPIRNRDDIFADIDQGVPEDQAAGLQDLRWVHYLVYTEKDPLCVGLNHLSAAYVKELRGKRSETIIFLNGKTENFIDLISRGCGEQTQGWLEIDEDQAIKALPELLPLMPVIIGDGTGQLGAKIQAYPALNELLDPISITVEAGPLQDLLAAVEELMPPLPSDYSSPNAP